jgi:hypothetical protein
MGGRTPEQAARFDSPVIVRTKGNGAVWKTAQDIPVSKPHLTSEKPEKHLRLQSFCKRTAFGRETNPRTLLAAKNYGRALG